MSAALANVVVHVSDIDRALHFYRDGLGLGVRFDGGARSDPTMLALTGTPAGAAMRIVVLDVDGSAGLTLSQVDQASAPTPTYEHGGFIHVGLEVDDLDTVLHRAGECGGTPFGTPATVGPPGRRCALAFLRDPDGSVVELVQRLPALDDPEHRDSSHAETPHDQTPHDQPPHDQRTKKDAA